MARSILTVLTAEKDVNKGKEKKKEEEETDKGYINKEHRI
jgi:hypothetical protein